MDGRVPVTPTRWVQNANVPTVPNPTVSNHTVPNPTAAEPRVQSTTVQKPRIAVKPKTPKTGDLTDEVLSSFGMTKEDITPVRDSTRDSARDAPKSASVKTPIRTQQQPQQSQQSQQPQHTQHTQQEYSPTRNAKSGQSQPVPSQNPQVHQRKVSPQVRIQPAPPAQSERRELAQPSTRSELTSAHTTKYTDTEIAEMLSNGYLSITRELWDFLPVGSHVRFFKKGLGSKNERFRPGGFIKRQYVTNEGKRILLMETIRDGSNLPGYITYPMAVDDLEEIWKRYPEECFIEIHLIHNSLVNKNKIINDLVARVTALESRIKK